MRESIYRCPLCGSRIDELHGMEAVEGDDRGYCYACENIAHEPEKIGERIHLYTKTALACRPHATLEQLAESCEALAEHVRELDEEGFEVVQSTPDGHIHLERMARSGFPEQVE